MSRALRVGAPRGSSGVAVGVVLALLCSAAACGGRVGGEASGGGGNGGGREDAGAEASASSTGADAGSTSGTTGGGGSSGGTGGSSLPPGNTLSGSFLGTTLLLHDGFAVESTAAAAGGGPVSLAIVLSDASNLCQRYETSDLQPDMHTLTIQLFQQLAGDPSPLVPGTYTLPLGPTPGTPSVSAAFASYDSSCVWTDVAGYAKSGSVILTHVDPTLVEGSFTVQFLSPDDAFTGTFSLPVCATTDVEPSMLSCTP